jgi:hypothetical protein
MKPLATGRDAGWHPARCPFLWGQRGITCGHRECGSTFRGRGNRPLSSRAIQPIASGRTPATGGRGRVVDPRHPSPEVFSARRRVTRRPGGRLRAVVADRRHRPADQRQGVEGGVRQPSARPPFAAGVSGSSFAKMTRTFKQRSCCRAYSSSSRSRLRRAAARTASQYRGELLRSGGSFVTVAPPMPPRGCGFHGLRAVHFFVRERNRSACRIRR